MPTTPFGAIRKSLAAAMTITALALVPVGAAQAAAPMVKTSAPGYFRMMLGDFEVTALSDGTVDLPVDQLLRHTTPARVDKALARSYLKSPLETSDNAYLVNTGTRLILIDTGAGHLFGPTLGQLVTNLKAAGYQPEQVDEIYITHMHPDHVGGLVTDGAIAFPNATVRADKRDADHWLSPQNLEKAPTESKGFFQGAMASLTPYVTARHFSAFEGDTELVPGIQAMATPGHTAGHTSYVIESKGQKLVIWGDLVHVAAVQFDDPAITIVYDSDTASAATQRKRAYADAARNGYLVAGSHIQFPGLGHVRAHGKAFAWVPVNYTLAR